MSDADKMSWLDDEEEEEEEGGTESQRWSSEVSDDDLQQFLAEPVEQKEKQETEPKDKEENDKEAVDETEKKASEESTEEKKEDKDQEKKEEELDKKEEDSEKEEVDKLPPLALLTCCLLWRGSCSSLPVTESETRLLQTADHPALLPLACSSAETPCSVAVQSWLCLCDAVATVYRETEPG